MRLGGEKMKSNFKQGNSVVDKKIEQVFFAG